MGFLTTNSFLFCLPLKVGGLVLAAFSIVVCIGESYKITAEHVQHGRYYSHHGKEFAAKIVLYQLQLIFAIFWLYGIFRKKAMWMVPYLSYNLIIFGALLMYYVVFVASFFVDFSLSRYMGINESRWAWVILITLLPSTLLAWHFTSVMYSLYRKVGKEHRLHPSVLYAPTTTPEEPITIKT